MRLRLSITTIFAALLSVCAMAQFAEAPAFPGAEGYGRYTTGGRGGKVIHVTNLNDSGEGSLRQAIETSGARIIVFDVSGTIYLQSTLSIRKGSVSILGQTAPGDGICVANCSVNVSASNVIIRYLRFRLGDIMESAIVASNPDYEGADAFTGSHHDNAVCSNIILDHCSASWSTDECASFYGNKNFTMQWCIISESLKSSVHAKGNHGYGGIWGGENAAFHHNLIANHDSRNPRFDHGYVSGLAGPVDYVNNVVYNWGGNSTYGGETADCYEQKLFNMQNNYYKPGPATQKRTRLLDVTTTCSNCVNCNGGGHKVVPGRFYLVGNVMEGSTAVSNDNWTGSTVSPANNPSIKSDTRLASTEDIFNTYNTIGMHTAQVAFEKVLAYAGCSFSRDVIDTRIANDTRNGVFTYKGSNGSTNGLIDSQEDVGGFPTLVDTGCLTDTDNDGMPDAWEVANGLDPNSASDASLMTLDKKHWYTNIEVYANSLVEEQILDARANAEATFEEYYPEYITTDGITKNQGSGDKSYDNEPQGVHESGVVVAEGTITWAFDTEDYLKDGVVSGINQYLASATVSAGSSLSMEKVRTMNDGVKIIGFRTASMDNAANDANGLYFSVIPSDGYAFRPETVSFYSSRIGTNGGNYDAKISNGSFERVMEANATPLRNDEWYHAVYELDGYAISSTSETLLSINIFNVGASKALGIGHIEMKGSVLKCDEHSSALDVVKSEVDDVYYVNLAGQRVKDGSRGIILRVEKMKDGRLNVTKIRKK